jgi:hypothetical protein
MFFSYSTVFSQLYVRPNGGIGGTDSYVYVTDEILFVEQDVHLMDNGAGTTRASIYLRDGGQLIQGTTASANNGTGLLSVRQNTPDDDAWDYTYWCSPVGNPTLGGGSAGNKNFGIQSYFDVTGLTTATQAGFTYAFNGIISPLTISRRWIYTHETPGTEAESHYNFRGHGYNIPAGSGFTMKGVGTTNHNQNYEFRGRPNNGTFSYTVAAPVSGVPQMTLAGNPYPSAIDLAMVVNTNPVSTIWFWDEDRGIDSHYYIDNRGGYGAWIPGGGGGGAYTPANFQEWDASGGSGGGGMGGPGGSYERRFSPIGQGFMLIGTANSTATIDNSMRVFVQEGLLNNSEFRGAEYIDPSDGFTNDSENIDPSNGLDNNDPYNLDPSIGINPGVEVDDRWPQLRLVTEFKDSHSRIMLLMFHETSTDGFDHGMDGHHPMDATSEAYFPIDGEPYVIETVPFEIGKAIPIAFMLEQQFYFSLTAVEEININKEAYLWDSLNDTSQLITDGYNAVLNLDAGTYEDRFFIVFKDQRQSRAEEGSLAINELKGSVEFFQNNNVKQLEVSNPDRYDIVSAQIFDMSGKLVINRSDIGNQSSFTFSTARLSDGVYLVKLTTVDNLDIDYRMVIYN